MARPRAWRQQGVGAVGVGRGDRVVGLEEAAGEGVIDLGEAVLAVAGQEGLGLGAGQRLGRGEAARGQLDGGQLAAELGGPRALRRPLDGLLEAGAGLVELAGQAPGDAADQGRVGPLGVLGLRIVGQLVQRGDGLGEPPLLHGGDDLGGQDRRRRGDGILGGGHAARRILGTAGDRGQQPQGEHETGTEGSVSRR